MLTKEGVVSITTAADAMISQKAFRAHHHSSKMQRQRPRDEAERNVDLVSEPSSREILQGSE